MKWCWISMCVFLGVTLWAQDPAATAQLAEDVGLNAVENLPDSVTETKLTLKKIVESGGFLIYVLAGMSVLAVAFILTFLISLSGGRILPTAFLRDLEAKLADGRFKEARAACETHKSPLAAMALAALEAKERQPEGDSDYLHQVVEGEGMRQASRLQSQITYLMDIGVIAPMVGLLGTVMGMLKSFSAVALDIAKARPVVLADGVSQALITTAAGLAVAIPAMAFYSFFRGRLAKLTSSMEVVAAELVMTLSQKPKDS